MYMPGPHFSFMDRNQYGEGPKSFQNFYRPDAQSSLRNVGGFRFLNHAFYL